MKKIILIFLLILPFTLFSQLKIGNDLTIVHFNAGWNSANNVKWVGGLSDAKIKRCDIATDTQSQAKHEIVVVPTIIIFKDGEEVARFQADLSFKMVATEEEVQEEIDNQLMSDF